MLYDRIKILFIILLTVSACGLLHAQQVDSTIVGDSLLTVVPPEFVIDSITGDTIPIPQAAGSDIKAHENEPLSLVRAVRSWFAENGVFGLASHNRIWDAYNEFLLRLSEEAKKLGYDDGDYSHLCTAEYIYLVTRLSPPTKA